MAFPPTDKTFTGLLTQMQTRLTFLERRLAGILPGRLQTSGQEVTDWNNAKETGFYWGINAANGPNAAWYVGTVQQRGTDARVVQELREVRGGATKVVYTRYWNGATWTAWDIPSDILDLVPYLSTGITYVPDTGTPGCYIRRLSNGLAEVYFNNVTVDSLSVPVNGNIANRNVFNGIPEAWRPTLAAAAIYPSSAGGIWSGAFYPSGSLVAVNYMPPVTQTATTTLTNQTLSGYGMYMIQPNP